MVHYLHILMAISPVLVQSSEGFPPTNGPDGNGVLNRASVQEKIVQCLPIGQNINGVQVVLEDLLHHLALKKVSKFNYCQSKFHLLFS